MSVGTVSEDRRVADVLHRDFEHIDTLRAIAANISGGLRHVQAREETYRAQAAARELVDRLVALGNAIATDVVEHRKAATS